MGAYDTPSRRPDGPVRQPRRQLTPGRVRYSLTAAPLPTGPSAEQAERDARLLAACTDRGHTPRKGFGGRKVACYPCVQAELLGEERAWTSAALPVSLQAQGTMLRRIFDRMADGGEYSVEGLAAQLGEGTNQQSVSALIRDLRKLGYTVTRTRRDGLTVYRLKR